VKASPKVALGIVVGSVLLKAFLDGSGTPPQVTHMANSPIMWLTPPHGVGGMMNVGEDHLPERSFYLEQSKHFSAISTSGSPTGTLVGPINWMLQVDGQNWVF